MDPSRTPCNPFIDLSQFAHNDNEETNQNPRPPNNPLSFLHGLSNVNYPPYSSLYQGFPPTYPQPYLIPQPILNHQSGNQYESALPTPITNAVATEFPAYSTQEMPSQSQQPIRGILKARWTTKDDLLLCSAWLNISKDGAIGNDQTGNSFWTRIEEFYNNYREQTEQAKRKKQALQNRWGRLSHAVSKFAGSYAQILHRRESGLNEADKKSRAMELYHETEKENFTFLHAWEVLKNEEKWCNHEGMTINVDLGEDRGSKRSKNTEAGKYTSSSSNTCSQACADLGAGISIARPMGRDASKRKGKGKGKKKQSPTQSMKSESLDEHMEKQYNLELEKMNVMKHYVKQKEETDKNNLILELMRLDTSTMDESQKKMYKKQIQKFLDE